MTIRTAREKGGRHVKRIAVLFCIGALLAACGGQPASEPNATAQSVSGRIVFTSDRDDELTAFFHGLNRDHIALMISSKANIDTRRYASLIEKASLAS